MKTKKSIIIAAIAVSVISLCTIVACSKENSANEANSTSTKDISLPTPPTRLAKHLEMFWNCCDSAYTANPNNFLSRCQDSNYAYFTQIGIKETLMDSLALEAKVYLDNFKQLNPSYQFDTSYCVSCANHSLENLGNKVAELHDLIEDIRQYEPGYCFTDIIFDGSVELFECLQRCYWLFMNSSVLPIEHYFCNVNCYLAEEIRNGSLYYSNLVENYGEIKDNN